MGNIMSRSKKHAVDLLESMVKNHPMTVSRDQLKDLLHWVHEQFLNTDAGVLFNPFLWDFVSLRFYNEATLKNTTVAKPLSVCRVVYDVVTKRWDAQHLSSNIQSVQRKSEKAEEGGVAASPSILAVSAAVKRSLTATQSEMGTIPVNRGHSNPVEVLPKDRGGISWVMGQPGTWRTFLCTAVGTRASAVQQNGGTRCASSIQQNVSSRYISSIQQMAVLYALP